MLPRNSVDFPLNTAVVDWRTIRSAGRAFTSEISLDDLLCFFSLTEGLVVYDNLYISPRDAPLPDAFEPLCTKGIIKISDLLPDALTDIKLKERSATMSSLLLHGEKARLSEIGSSNQSNESSFARFLFAETNNIDSIIHPILTAYVPLLEYYDRRSQVARLYDRVATIFRNEIDELIALRSPMRVYVPPAPALILQRAATQVNKLIDEILVMRDEFAQFRKKYRQHQAVLSAPNNYKLAELLDAKRESFFEVEMALNAISKSRQTSRLMMEIYDAVVGASLSPDDNGMELKVSSPISKLLGLGLKELGIRIVRGRARCLFDLWRNVLEIRGYDSLVTNTFDLEDSALNEDLSLVKSLARWIEDKNKEKGDES